MNQNIYCVNISTSHGPGISKSQGGSMYRHPVSYSALELHKQEREKHLAHEKKVQQEFEAMRERGHKKKHDR